jgi:hypothetical protein
MRDRRAVVGTPPDQTIEALRAIVAAQPREFVGDEVLDHVRDCIDELERIRSGG